MPLLPERQPDQVKLLVAIASVALAVCYYVYPYSNTETQMAADRERIAALTAINDSASRVFTPGSIRRLRERAAENRAVLLAMRRLVPTSNEVPALLEEVSTAARRAGLDVGGVIPEPVLPGAHFDTYRYSITIIGGYHQVGEFLANVGSLPRIVAPVQLSIAPAGGQGGGARGRASAVQTSARGTLATSILLQTYVERTAKSPPAADGSQS